MPRIARPPHILRQCGDRLRVLRGALDLTQDAAAKVAGVSKSAWTNYETAQRLPDALAVMRFCRRFGVTTDWVWLGNAAGLPAEVRNKVLILAAKSSLAVE